MSSVSNIASNLSSNSGSSSGSDRLNELTMSDFIKMMTAELENQDPLDPMSNTEMLSQINQMRQITSNDKLTSSIENLTLGQSLSTASGMIGKTVTGVNTLGKEITGTVDKVVIENGTPKLYVGSSIILLENITTLVNPADPGGSGSTPTDPDPTDPDPTDPDPTDPDPGSSESETDPVVPPETDDNESDDPSNEDSGE